MIDHDLVDDIFWSSPSSLVDLSKINFAASEEQLSCSTILTMAVMFAKLHNFRGTRKQNCFKARFDLIKVRFYLLNIWFCVFISYKE